MVAIKEISPRVFSIALGVSLRAGQIPRRGGMSIFDHIDQRLALLTNRTDRLPLWLSILVIGFLSVLGWAVSSAIVLGLRSLL